MKRCSKCGTQYAGEVARCPRDGAQVVEVKARPAAPIALAPSTMGLGTGDSPREQPLSDTMNLEQPKEGAIECSSDLAHEIEDLLFKVCTQCHSTYGGAVDACPKDGQPLVEHSLLHHPTMAMGTGELTAQFKKYCPRCKKHFDLNMKVCGDCGSGLMIPTLGGATVEGRRAAELGTVIADKYRLLEDIGTGGFGSVYLAKHEALGKRYAIKMLRAQLADATNFRNRFHEEALKLSRLEDENIVKVIDFGEWHDCQYMVTEYVEGKELGSLIYGEKVTPLRAAKIMKQVASALAEAHAKKIVHLDLKPPNVLVSQKRGRDTPKIIDFGIAEIYSDTKAKRQEAVVGTCTYMAPEQWRQEPLDPRTDVYSYGVIFYEFLAGRPPFRHHTISGLKKAHCETPPASLRKIRADIPVELERLVMHCLEKSPQKRIGSAEEIEKALDAYIRRSENRLAAILKYAAIAAAVLALLAAGAWVVYDQYLRDKEKPEWVSFTAVSEAGVELTSPNPREYLTRDKAVTLKLKARDNRAVDHILVDAPGLERPNYHVDDVIEIPLANEGAEVSVTAVAFDPSGNESDPLLLQFKRLLGPSLGADIGYEGKPKGPYTSKADAWVKIDELRATRALLTCTNQGDEIVRHPVEKTEVFPFKLRNGKNTVKLTLIDVLTGAESPSKYSWEVSLETRPLQVSARLLKSASLLELPNGIWASKDEDGKIEVEVDVADALARFEPGKLEFRFRVNEEEERTIAGSDAPNGRSRLGVRLAKPGKNTVTLQPVYDRYGYASKAQTWEVDWDRDPPKISIENDAPDVPGKESPTVRFKVSDPHLDRDAVEVLKRTEEGEKVLSPEEFKLLQKDDGAVELTLPEALLPNDDTYEFRIEAADALGLKSKGDVGRFTVRVDRNPPVIKVRQREPGTAFKRGDLVTIEAEVSDKFLQQVRAVIAFTAPGVEVKQPFTMARLEERGTIWRGTISLDEQGALKPKRFDTREPSFTIEVTAADELQHESRVEVAARFAWENGDQLLWKWKGGLMTLVYHEARASGSRAFWIGETEVTNEQYGRFLQATRGGSGAAAGTPELPVRGVTWKEAQAFAALAGLELPTQDEWQVAALWDHDKRKFRAYPWGETWPAAGSPLPFHGDKKNGPVAAACADGPLARGKTPPPFGLMHMFGNVWELVYDEESKSPTWVGGSFKTPAYAFSEKKNEEVRDYLLRGKEAGNVGADEIGFRCVLRE